MKRLIGKFASLAGAAFLASTALADTWTDENERTWTFTTNKTAATITGLDPIRGVIAIPATLAGKPVTSIGTIFKGQENVTRVTIPAGVTAIPDQAFLNCKNLKGVTINGETLTSIGYQAFMGCYNMTSFVIPNSVKTLGQGAFSGCLAMEEVTIGDGVEALTGVTYKPNYSGCYGDYDDSTSLHGSHENGLFYNCTSLKTINWGKNVKTIGNVAFLGCKALEEVEIPDTVTSIGYHAFYWCENLGEVKIGNKVTTVGRMAFRADGNLTKVTFGNAVTEIQQQAFQDCVNLQNFTLPTSIQYLRYRCFAGCKNAMTEVTIPTNKDELETELEQGVFSGCTQLETVTIGDTVKTLTGVTYKPNYSGCYGDYDDSTSLHGSHENGLFYNCTSLKTINWGKNVKTIGNVAFLGCKALEEVEIPDTVTSIGYHAFYWCENLGEVKIGNKVTTVGRMAFRADGNLTKVTFGNAVTEIQQQAFQDCVNLQNFTLPTSIQYLRYRCFAGCKNAMTEVTIPTNKDELETELEQGVFSGCTKLETVTIGDTVKTLTGVTYKPNYSGCYGDYDDSTSLHGSYENGLFYNCTSLKTINWGKGVKTIGNVAFLCCKALEKVEIPDTVTLIGNHAFFWCSNLGEVKIGNKVTTVGRMAFRADGNLTKVTFGNSVTEIQQQAFQDCVNLQNFTLPTSIQYLRYRCFAGCSKALTEVTIPTNKDELETELEQGVFSGCTKLETVTMGDTVKTLTGVAYKPNYSGCYGDYDDSTNLHGSYENGLFYNCTSLKTINLGCGLKTIGNVAFLNCSALKTVSLPANVNSIGCHAFCNCSSLKTIEAAGAITYIGRRAFANCPQLHWASFQGDSMAYDAGEELFKFDKDRLVIYVKPNSTGWTGVADVGGLSESGTWRGAKIVYGRASADAANPYDFYPQNGTFVAKYVGNNYEWSASVVLTTNRYVQGAVTPVREVATVVQGDPVYLHYAFNEYWRGETVSAMTNTFTLAGDAEGTESLECNIANKDYDYGWGTNCVLEILQDLEPGEYTLTMNLNAARNLAETDYANNTTSIAFTVIASAEPIVYKTVTFDANEGVCATATKKVVSGKAIGELPTATREGYNFLGWFTAKTAGDQVTAETKVTADVTWYAQWEEIPEPEPDVYTVTFDANGGTCATETKQVEDGESVGALPTATRTDYAFLGWFTAKTGGEQVTAETTVTAGVTWYAQWKEEKKEPTYGPWGESEDVANPDRLAPTQLKQTSATIYDAVAAKGDCVAAFRGDTGALCGLGKVLNDAGTLTIVYYAPKGVTLSFKVWQATSGTDNPTILDCDAKCNLVAGTVGETVTGHKLVVSDNVDLTLTLKNAGWQAVSFNVEADDPSPAAVFAAVADKIDSVVEGISYWEPDDEGTLAKVKVGKAYWVKTLVDNVSWTVTGKTHPETEISLKSGWNLIGYTLENAAAVEHALATALEDGVISDIVCGIDFYPDGTLAQVKPGKAYWVKATQAYTLVYDEVPTVKMVAAGVRSPLLAAAAASNPKYGPWGDEDVEVPNPDRLSPSILKKIAVMEDGVAIADGDVVAAFRGDTDALCGLGTAKDGKVTIVTYAPAGVELSFKLWVAESGMEESVVVEADETVVATGDNQENLTLAFSTVEPVIAHVVTFDPNGGTLAVTNQRAVVEGEAVGDLPVPVAPATATFAGWFTAAKGGARVTSETTVPEDVTWYAQWTYPVPTYTVIVGAKASVDIGLKGQGYSTKTLPKGLSYSDKTGLVTGTCKTATAAEGVEVTFTKKNAENIVLIFIARVENKPAIECEGLDGTTLTLGVTGGSAGIPLDLGAESGVKSVTATKLPTGMKIASSKDKTSWYITGAPTKAGTYEVAITLTTAAGNKVTQKFTVTVAALPSGATGTFNGFVQKAGAGEGETLNAGSFQVTVSDLGKITAKVVAAAGTYSFTATGWDSVNEGVYSVEMMTKKGDVLALTCDSTAAWNDHQLTGSFVASGATALSVEAQKNAFGKQWFFNATGDDANGWTLSFAENAKAVALTVTLNADGKTSVAGKLGAYKITASGYADVSGVEAGAIFADFAPVVTVGKTKKVLSLRANLWFDKKNDHEEGVGSAVFAP